MNTETNGNNKAHSSSPKKKSVVFRCDTIGYMGDESTGIVLYADGTLKNCVYDAWGKLLSEHELQKKPDLVNTIRQLARDNKDRLNSLPRILRNPFVLDGAHNEIQIGRMKFAGPNILTTKVNEEDCNPANKFYRPGHECVKDLARFQKVFEHFIKAVNEGVGEKVIWIVSKGKHDAIQ